MPYSLTRSQEQPAARAARLNEELHHASAHTICRVAMVREFPSRVCYVCSFGAQSAAMLAVIADIDRDFPVLFIDTGMHFRATLDYSRRLVAKLGLTNVRRLGPSPETLDTIDPKKNLWSSDPDRCCHIRKVEPLKPALDGFDAWITGRKHSHGGLRRDLPMFEYSEGKFKINPLVAWTQEDVASYTAARGLDLHPMIEEGYSSIGCWPCSAPTHDREDSRSGRWAGRGKTECGLHIAHSAAARVLTGKVRQGVAGDPDPRV